MFDSTRYNLTRRAFLKFLALGGAVAALQACDGAESTPPPPTVQPTITPTATPAPQPADVTARLFLDAWNKGNYAAMYAALAPASQTKISQNDFIARYQSVLSEATITQVNAALTSIAAEGSTATAQFKVHFETALLGPLEQTNAFSLLREQGKWGILWSPRLILSQLENGNRVKLYVTKSTRGNIYDRTGAPLAIGVQALVVNVWPAEMRRNGVEAQVLAALEPILGLSQNDIKKRYGGQNPEWKIPIQTIAPEIAQANAEALSLPGIVLEEQDARQYPLGAAAGHIAGYVGQISADELGELYGKGYREGEYFGRAGLEHLAEEYLSGGRGGKLVALNADGAPVQVIAERAAEQSQSVYATLDSELQKHLATLLNDKRGSITVMDVKTGGILAMFSSPGFDSNAFVDRERNQERANYLTSPQKIMLNRATQGAYPHGSVQKIITTATALERGGMSPHTPFHCTGIWKGLGYPKACWINAYGKTHGNISLQNALTQSCDIAFYETGLILHKQDPNLLTDFCRAFGLGSETGIGLQEVAGNVPDPRVQEWQPTDSTDMAIGQDTFQTTPLQVVNFVAAVANGGVLWRPNLIAKIQDFVNETEQIVQPQKRGELPVSAANLQAVREGMRGVTMSKDGTAAFVFDKLPVSTAGKTGTSQVAGNHDPHAWFAGYAPFEDPQIACCVMVENGGEGSKVAAPIFRKVIEKYFNVKPPPPAKKGEPTPTPPPSE
ncbi:twin-arginine translocation signal domain-containing protein [Anaerolineae bacterium CFX7]|nr:twin-arginine translocation signal domain-containing protein [Anaerolineae bacterium CFX7]